MSEAPARTDGSPPPAPLPVDAPAPPPLRRLQVKTDGLTRSYGGKLALNNLNLSIAEGEIFGFIGPNGAGKTTTIRILAGLLLPTRGKAEVDGFDVTRDSRKVKEVVGYMPDSFGVYDNMTLLEYLDFFGAAFKIPRPKRKSVIRDVLELTDLTAKREDQVSTFSRGMKQRACLAKTLLHDPKVLLLDEPASGLDPRARIELRELLKELQRMGKTIIVSSHILTELATFCNTVGIIEAGNLVAAGPVEEILKSVRSSRRFVVELLEAADAQRAAALLPQSHGVAEVRAEGRTIRFQLDATELDVAGVVAGLSAERIRFTSFREELADLETAFLTLTKGDLA